jgi:DNA-binding transcriptional LysR family regulator
MNLRRLRHAVLLAEERHFGRAAARAHLTQSAFSRSIQELERSLGLQLFDRDLRHVRITPAGARLVARAARLLLVSDDLARELELLRSGDLGDIAIGAGPYSGAEVLPDTLARLHREHPEVQVRLEVNGWEGLLESLRQERIDFFVSDLREVPPDSDLLVEPLGFLYVSLFCHASSDLPKRAAIPVARLRERRFVTVNIAQSAKKELAQRIYGIPDAVLPIVFECDNPVMIREFAVRSGAILLGTHASPNSNPGSCARSASKSSNRPASPRWKPPSR